MTIKKYVAYSDLNENPTSDRDVVIKDVYAVNQAIDNLIEIIKGERLFNNSGLDPEAQLFELGVEGEADDFFNEIVQEIVNNEPRIELNLSKSEVIPDYDNNRYTLSLVYTLVGISTQEFEYVRSL
jgi:hypothetical protein